MSAFVFIVVTPNKYNRKRVEPQIYYFNCTEKKEREKKKQNQH
jgi:hypothetical protein